MQNKSENGINGPSKNDSRQGSQQNKSAGNNFIAIFERIKQALGVATETAIANLLGIKQPSVAKARKRNKIPPGWITKISQEHEISADWLLFGEGPMVRADRLLSDIVRKIDNYKLENYKKDKEWIINSNKRLKALVDRQIEYMEKTEKFDAEMVKSLLNLVKSIESWSALSNDEG